jgi:hypothetical protein
MPIERYPDWEMRIKRQDAFWQREIIDRPVVSMSGWQEDPDFPFPVTPTNVRDRWLDVQYVAERSLADAMAMRCYGDALPTIMPNLGPEVFSAFFGCELGFGENTSWSEPIIDDWSDTSRVKFSEDSFYWKKLLELMDACLEVGKGRFYTGITDIHPGGDAIAAFRDPVRLNMDMIEAVDDVKSMLRTVTDTFFQVYDFYYDKLRAAGQPASTWASIVSSKKWYVPSNDFSCMISKEMFDDIFLPGIAEECRFLEASIYHLDGPDALRHLDSLLEIPELNAIQWVYGAGNGRATDWLHIYKKCQDAGKGVQIYCDLSELDAIMEALRPEGVWLAVSSAGDEEAAQAVIKKVSNWIR